MFKALKGLAVVTLGFLGMVWASPGETQGRVDAYDPQAGYIVVNGVRLVLGPSLVIRYGPPRVGSLVEVKLAGVNGTVRSIEVKGRAGNSPGRAGDIYGRVDVWDQGAGYVVVNGQRYGLVNNLTLKYGSPKVGDYVKLYLTYAQGQAVVYKLESKKEDFKSSENRKNEDDH